MFSKALVLAVMAYCVYADDDYGLAWKPICSDLNENKIIRNPFDCNIFYTCVGGIPIKQNCPAGLLFNLKTKACDWPKKVKCSLKGDADVEQEPEELMEVRNIEVDEISDEETSTWGAPYCPIHGKKLILLPNPRNCRTFYICSNGVPQLTKCPAGLRYNRHKRVCDWPKNVPCKKI